MLIAIPLHEFGHYIGARWTGHKARLHLTFVEYEGKRERSVALTGVLFGILPFVHSPLLLPAYLYGCKEDLKEIWKTKKKRNLKSLNGF